MALLEVQIEGPFGWAAGLPTWRIVLPFSIFGTFGFADKPLTGYHLYLCLLLFVLPHFAFFFTKWSLKKELFVLSFYALFTTFEGIFWFLVNPAYGLRNFTQDGVGWYRHETWLIVPLEYYPRFIFGGILYWLANSNIEFKSIKFLKPQK